MITAATNKNEEFNGFLKWVFFANRGIIQENNYHNQTNIVKYNQLVGNMLTLYNCVKMEEVFEQLVHEGYNITPDILAGFSPFRRSTTNLYGDYSIDFTRPLDPLDFDKTIKS